MALPLVSFIRDDSPKDNPSYSAQLVSTTVQTLAANFVYAPSFYPFFVLDSGVENCVLSALLKHVHPDIEGCFENEAMDGVSVWPQPVQMGDVSLMLFKLSEPSDESMQNYMELRRKVMLGLTALSSVCCICESKSPLFSFMDAFLQDYSAVSQSLQLEISQVEIFLEDAWLQDPRYKTELDLRTNASKPCFGIVNKRDNDDSWVWQLATRLADRQFHEPFRSSHSHLMREPYISGFLHWTHILMQLANLNRHFHTFASKLPSTFDPEAERKVEICLKIAERADYVCKNARALQFSGETGREPLVLDPSILESLLRTYNLNDPTVILALMGSQGVGKSTLLNYIFQFCTETHQPPSIFQVKNTCRNASRGSQVLSHPLSYKEKQIMLMDLEDMGGTEIAEREAVMQQNRVSALLTVASVPCILIRNSFESIKFVENTVAQIATLQLEFGFYTERIHLLCHDRNLEAGPNDNFETLATDLNRRHFEGRKVVTVLNKPNFINESASAQKQLFLRTLLDDSLYTKKRASKAPVTIQELLTLVNVIATRTNSSQLQLSPTERNRRDGHPLREEAKVQKTSAKGLFARLFGL